MRAAAGLLAAVALAACSPGNDGPETGWVVFPEEVQERALHCSVLLAATLSHMEELAGVGPRAGFITGRPNTTQVRAAHDNSVDALDGARRTRLVAEGARLEASLLRSFDRNGDDRLSSDEELAEFNRHIRRCVEAYA